MQGVPCKRECERRSATCHATCEEYKKFYEENLEAYERRRVLCICGESTPGYKRTIRRRREYRKRLRG